MQIKPKTPLKSKQWGAHSSEDQELSLQLLNTTQDFLNEQDFLSEEFSLCSYKLYKFWLASTFIIALLVEYDAIHYFFWIFKNIRHYPTLLDFAMAITPTIISFLFLLLGCGQIFLAITKKRSSMSQRSLLKFQYSMIAAIFGSILRTQVPNFKFNMALFTSTGFIAWPTLISTHLVVSSAVLKVFQQNNPLARPKDCSKNFEGAGDALESDFWEQNEAISLEVSRFDRQLNNWRYSIYKFWLRVAVVVQIFLLSGVIIVKIIAVLREMEQKRNQRTEFEVLSLLQFAFLLLTFGFTAYCSYKMEVVLRVKMLEISKKVLVALKICIFVAIITSVLAFIQFGTEGSFWVKIRSCFFGLIFVPLVTFFGASYANKIIEQRSQFVKVSSYNEDFYV